MIVAPPSVDYAATTCLVDAAARGKSAAPAHVSLARLSLERKGYQSVGKQSQAARYVSGWLGFPSNADWSHIRADIPKLEQIIVSRLRQAVHDRYVWPRFLGIGLPRLVSKGVEPVVAAPDGSVMAASSTAGTRPERAREMPLSTPALMETIPGGSSAFTVPERIVSPPSGGSSRQGTMQPPQSSLQPPTVKPKRRAESAILGANETDDTDDGMDEDMRYRNGPALTAMDERDLERSRWRQGVSDARPQETIRPSGRSGHYATTSMGSRVGLDPMRHGNQATVEGGMRYRGVVQGDISQSVNGSASGSATGVGMASANGTLPARRMGALNARGLGSR